MNKARLVWIDQARGLALLLVVLFHANTLLRFGYEQIPSLTTLYSAFVPFRMPLLIFLSGFIAYFSLDKPVRPFVWGKVSAIAWPYLVWTVVHYFGVGARYSPWDPSLYLSYLWFLGYIFLYYLISWALKSLYKLPLILSAFVISGTIPEDEETFRRFFFLWGIFMLGEIAHQKLEGFLQLLRSRSIIILLVPAVISSIVAVIATANGARIHYDPVHLAGILSGILLACTAFVRLGPRLPASISRALSYLGQNSVVFYVTHFPAIYFSIALLALYGVDSPWFAYFFAVSSALAIGLLFCVLRRRSTLFNLLFELPSAHAGEIQSRRWWHAWTRNQSQPARTEG